jgi:hypothetical protein
MGFNFVKKIAKSISTLILYRYRVYLPGMNIHQNSSAHLVRSLAIRWAERRLERDVVIRRVGEAAEPVAKARAWLV